MQANAVTSTPDARDARLVVSVVSHGQGELVDRLLADIAEHWDHPRLAVVLTQNLPESDPAMAEGVPFPLHIVRNLRPRGFAANHNAAYSTLDSDIFCVVNPDVRCPRDPVPALLEALAEPDVALAAPLVVSPGGEVEDSARRRITPGRILRRGLGMDAGPDYEIDPARPVYPDWVAGMFMALRSEAFAGVGGFDERYQLYCEDADLCMRLWSGGHRVRLVPAVHAVHDARRQSHRDMKYLRWHIASLMRFFVRYPGHRPLRDVGAA